jgi:hypothetical protein
VATLDVEHHTLDHALPIGKFTEDDRKVFAESLTKSLGQIIYANVKSSGDILNVLVALNYTTYGAGTLCMAFCEVDWALVNKSGTLIFNEQFFATYKQEPIGTMGSVKQTVNGSIIKRIVATAIEVANNPEKPLRGVNVLHTYDDVNDALSQLPDAYRGFELWTQERKVGHVTYMAVHYSTFTSYVPKPLIKEQSIDWSKYVSSIMR